MNDVQHWFSTDCFGKEKLSADIDKHVLQSQIDDLKGRIDVVRGAIDDVKPPQRFPLFGDLACRQQAVFQQPVRTGLVSGIFG